MVTLDPCARLKTIQKQVLPSIINSASIETDTLDIRAAIEKSLPVGKGEKGTSRGTGE